MVNDWHDLEDYGTAPAAGCIWGALFAAGAWLVAAGLALILFAAIRHIT